MRVKASFTGREVVVSLEGELDLRGGEEFRQVAEEMMRESGCYRLVVNLKKVTFLDSAGIGALLGRLRTVKQRGGEMVLEDPSPRVKALLEAAGTGRLWRMVTGDRRRG